MTPNLTDVAPLAIIALPVPLHGRCSRSITRARARECSPPRYPPPAPAPAPENSTNLVNAASADATGLSASRKDGRHKADVKSEKELDKERKKADKNAKFQAKKKAQPQAAGPPGSAGNKKDKKDKDESALPAYVEETAKGDKKMLKSLDDPYHKAYMPAVVESAWYDWWEKEGFFKPEFTQDGEPKAKGTFVIPIPPPNVTGKLHCGHALATSLQDLLVRWHRTQGYTTLYLPGCDHAAIPTQAVVEKMLWRQEKKTRHDLGRPKFLETTLAWVDEYKGNITAVLKRLGGSFDWTREAFTMMNFSTAVIKVFVCMRQSYL
ncbi:hypothetical protein HBI37_225140 [Parastagonospora nodorum]|nr:hypothetical protein HBI37_225140 [Parastagonospora nodorum]KAH6336462.1 hypothetical protein HBI36_223410 [Parastagonospora nodorum]